MCYNWQEVLVTHERTNDSEPGNMASPCHWCHTRAPGHRYPKGPQMICDRCYDGASNKSGDTLDPLDAALWALADVAAPTSVSTGRHYVVDSILARRTRNGERQSLVRWKGCKGLHPDAPAGVSVSTECDDSWEPEANLRADGIDVEAMYRVRPRSRHTARPAVSAARIELPPMPVLPGGLLSSPPGDSVDLQA